MLIGHSWAQGNTTFNWADFYGAHGYESAFKNVFSISEIAECKFSY